ncbi:uncharacterized protein SPAPADRAFT_67601 [Spathaspora passalidarum NRRL Y-27907]|uniref:Cleavage and polyadenylation specificity factor subunit 2 n=1 Tax=Spathaspora passalidarum (strain NRRL Y-27907 / 11-Y1) TaxID=619300 RepID=G3AQK8_SPAPN|nr:uncharacterized protein SPAPADRAFT_67601 [Spathaspora passalidarum NRRL Y-27907]EGW31555.1 hypothetical protein SPAPADRAFT_67601 [Spathaspora passalidarum NRRL Y-27907]
MFSFSLISPSEGDLSFKASLLSFDNEFKLLADPSWDGKDANAVLFMEQHLSEVNAVLLSHSTPDFISGYVLLCLKFPNLMSTMPVYSTLPVNQLGRISTVEYYRANGVLGPLDSAILEIDEVDNWFDRVTLLKYQQSTNLMDNKVTITPYNAGHTLGGAFWLIVKRIDKVIYAPAWNHSKDSFLNSASFISTSTGNPLLSLLRPTAFITAPDLGSTMPHKRRTEKFLQLVDATLANGGAALLPTSLSGRFLELFHLIDEHLQGAPIPVYFLSYSGTRILSYASNLLDWMSGSFIKSWDETSGDGGRGGGKALSSMPFDPSKVDLLLDPSELIQLSGPKIVFCSGIDIKSGDISSETFQYLCNNEKTTVILTEKSQLENGGLNSMLYKEWYELTKKKLGGKIEDGTAVPLDKTVSIEDWTRETNLEGRELSDFQERITQQRKEKLLAKVRDKKNQNILNAENVDDEDSSEDEDEEEQVPEEETKGEAAKSVTTTDAIVTTATSVVDELAAHEAFVMDHIKQSLKDNIPIDLKITHRLRPRSAMFPYFMTTRKQKFDDYGQVIDVADFEKTDETSNAKIIMEGKKKFDEKRRWNEEKSNDDNKQKKNQNKQQANKLTPQEQLNQQLIQKNLDTLYNPRKRVPLNAASSFASQSQMLKIRCGLSFVDLSGLVDLRSLGIIVQALKPYNLLLLPDFNSIPELEVNGLKQVQEMFDHQQNEQLQEESKKKILTSSRYLSLSSIRSGLSSAISTYGGNKMNVLVVESDKPVKIGTESESGGIGLNNFEINLDDSIIKDLRWQKIGSNYRVAKVHGELELQNPIAKEKTERTLSDYINPTTYFTLKKSDDESLRKRRKVVNQRLQDPKLKPLISNGPKLAIGNIRLPDLRKNLQEKNMNAEFKQEGTLVVNDVLTIRKVAYGTSESDDSGDIVIEGNYSRLHQYTKMRPYSKSGGTAKCFYEFQTFVACYTSAETVNRKECTPAFEDYAECLHGTKERERARLMMQQLKENEQNKSGVTASDLYKSSGRVYENLDLIKQ